MIVLVVVWISVFYITALEMTIKSLNSVSECSIKLSEANETQGYHPSMAFSCRASGEDFSGKLSQIWFDVRCRFNKGLLF
jgi:hypothetical protein